MLYMLSIYAQCYDAILYCMGTVDKGIVDMETIIWGPLIWGPSTYVTINMRSWDSIGGVDMYHYNRQVGVGLRYCDTYQLSLCVRSVVVITLSCNCRTET